MHEILFHLPPGSRILDLGSGRGSFDASAFPSLHVFSVDLYRPPSPTKLFAQADAARLPCAAGAFDAVICGHTLEHFEDLDSALKEIGRVIKRSGSFFASVPDASTLTDRVYRWLFDGGGHVNPITSASEFASRIERAVGLRQSGRRVLLSSFAFANSKNSPNGPPKKILHTLRLDRERVLVVFTWLFRRLDSLVGTRTSIYGWAFWFGAIPGAIDPNIWANVCVRCGCGSSSEHLITRKLVTGRGWFQRYACPNCGATTLVVPDRSMRRVK